MNSGPKIYRSWAYSGAKTDYILVFLPPDDESMRIGNAFTRGQLSDMLTNGWLPTGAVFKRKEKHLMVYGKEFKKQRLVEIEWPTKNIVYCPKDSKPEQRVRVAVPSSN